MEKCPTCQALSNTTIINLCDARKNAANGCPYCRLLLDILEAFCVSPDFEFPEEIVFQEDGGEILINWLENDTNRDRFCLELYSHEGTEIVLFKIPITHRGPLP
jgi:hypothetical protein